MARQATAAERTDLLPADKLLRTRVVEWLCFEQSNVDQVIARARFRRVYPHVIPTRPEEFVAWHRQGTRALSILNTHLEEHAFVVAERYTIADIALYAYTHCADEGGFELERFPALRSWFNRVEQMPDYLPIDQVPA